ncbi:MAG: YhbY family RNA-binding protein, partial [Nanoarchaeota archaeon]
LGKSGISEGVIEEISKHLKRRELIKIRLLRAFPLIDRRQEVAETLAERTQSTLVQVTGNTIVLFRQRTA